MPCVLPFFFLFSVRKFAFSLAFLFLTKCSLLLANFLYRSTVSAGLVPWFENWKSLKGFFVNLEGEISWIVFEGVQENLKFLRNENLSELNDEAVFFWQRIKRWSQFHEYLRNKRFGKKKKKRNEVEGNGKVITCFLRAKNFHKNSLLWIFPKINSNLYLSR